MQFEKLKSVLLMPEMECHFISSDLKSRLFIISDFKSLDDMQHLPVLEREEVIAHHEDLVDYRLKSEIMFGQ